MPNSGDTGEAAEITDPSSREQGLQGIICELPFAQGREHTHGWGGSHVLLMFCYEIILYKQSLEIHLCMLSHLVLSEVVSEPVILSRSFTFSQFQKVPFQQSPLPSALGLLSQWTYKKLKQNSPNHCCLVTRISQSYLSTLRLEKHESFSFYFQYSAKEKECWFLAHSESRPALSGNSLSVPQLTCQEENYHFSDLQKPDRCACLSLNEFLFHENGDFKLFSV